VISSWLLVPRNLLLIIAIPNNSGLRNKPHINLLDATGAGIKIRKNYLLNLFLSPAKPNKPVAKLAKSNIVVGSQG